MRCYIKLSKNTDCNKRYTLYTYFVISRTFISDEICYYNPNITVVMSNQNLIWGISTMFPEFRDLITKLKTEDAHFANLFDKHNELDQRIKNIESNIELGTHNEVELLKKEKLRLKDAMYEVLKKADAK